MVEATPPLKFGQNQLRSATIEFVVALGSEVVVGGVCVTCKKQCHPSCQFSTGYVPALDNT